MEYKKRTDNKLMHSTKFKESVKFLFFRIHILFFIYDRQCQFESLTCMFYGAHCDFFYCVICPACCNSCTHASSGAVGGQTDLECTLNTTYTAEASIWPPISPPT